MERSVRCQTRDTCTLTTVSFVQTHLGWDAAHIVGHSMGGMIAMKLAVQSPQRVCSLSIVSATGGGWQSLPFSWRAAKYMWKVRRCRISQQRAVANAEMHRLTLAHVAPRYFAGIQSRQRA